MENIPEKKPLEDAPERQEQGYIPRPAWQVWAARAAVVVFFILVILQIVSIARGGL